MEIKKPQWPYFVIFMLFSVTIFTAFSYAEKSNNEFKLSKEVVLEKAQSLAVDSLGNSSEGSWSIFEKLFVDKEAELEAVPLAIKDERKRYFEERTSFNTDGTTSVTQREYIDKERTVGAKLLNVKTGETQVIPIDTKITPSGVDIVAPPGYEIEIVKRENGIGWNYWNTQFRVIKPKDTVFIKNCFPREKNILVYKLIGERIHEDLEETIECFSYAPYSEYLHQDEIVEFGVSYDKSIVSWAFSLLRERGVRSKAFPDKLVADVEFLSSRFFERLPLLEQMDFTEFVLDPQKSAERVLVIIGTNRENAWAYTCNRADACGWVQFTPGTYAYMRTSYPNAELIEDFKEGAADHVNSIMSAILLHDSNLASLIERYGQCIAQDPRLEELLAASYNGSPRHVFNSLNEKLTDSCNVPSDWGVHLRIETIGFMDKLRYLIENRLP